jgi:hypothetical protein
MTERFLRRREAAEYVHAKYGFCSDKTLAKLATVGGGPIYQKAGKFPLYKMEDLDGWAASKLSKPVRSTAEYEAARAMRASDTAKPAPAIAWRGGPPAHDDRDGGGV